ncbi:sulfotransferase family protein [Gluconacetobacter entanii]|uniref:Sulfotransferase family protein n=1 Tax=Gluconacetobacter entanii TaxID=108528 RepID=A0ABT3K9X2_9PROT|nr:sulfotransferase family protein [Gluconacetobacter entanii]MCW4592210.1 sulfotransferase family protein [Gluconacetobacter entanii]MCW4595781.1 sulfotransferase family protein [Gluconacetobacter entanii]
MSTDSPTSECSVNPRHRVSQSALPQTLFHSLTRRMGFQLPSDFHEWAADHGLYIPHGRKRRARMQLIAQRGVLFIHVPKNAGTSIATALYGRPMLHETMHFFATTAPAALRRLPSVAIMRDPVARFVSSYCYARAGGGRHRQVVDTFRERYMNFRSVDDALDHVENARSVYDMDHIFRPQSWYVNDRSDRLLVDHLVPMQAVTNLHRILPAFRDVPIRHLNESTSQDVALTARQTARIHALYRQDAVLYDRSVKEADRFR